MSIETSKTKLARHLREVGLEDMAKKAEAGHYSDYESPLDLPATQLEEDLRAARDANNHDIQKYAAIERVRLMHVDGQFDATDEEADAWAASPDGQAAFKELGLLPYVKDNDNKEG